MIDVHDSTAHESYELLSIAENSFFFSWKTHTHTLKYGIEWYVCEFKYSFFEKEINHTKRERD